MTPGGGGGVCFAKHTLSNLVSPEIYQENDGKRDVFGVSDVVQFACHVNSESVDYDVIALTTIFPILVVGSHSIL